MKIQYKQIYFVIDKSFCFGNLFGGAHAICRDTQIGNSL